jgi:hypothetical protein
MSQSGQRASFKRNDTGLTRSKRPTLRCDPVSFTSMQLPQELRLLVKRRLRAQLIYPSLPQGIENRLTRRVLETGHSSKLI